MREPDRERPRPRPALAFWRSRLAMAIARPFASRSVLLAVALLALLSLGQRAPADPAAPAPIPLETDADADGVPDATDLCPSQAGLLPDGCPPRDRDGDGVLDRLDGCIEMPGPVDNRGCPDTDTDQDRVVDRHDTCVDRAGRPRFSGCPAPDRDGDAIPDPDDSCPESPETWNLKRDLDGCPDSGAPLLEVTDGTQIVLAGRVFRSSGALHKSGKRPLATAASLAAHAGVVRIRVTIELGTADERDAEARARRTASVTQALGQELSGVTIEVVERESRPMESGASKDGTPVHARVLLTVE